MSTTTADKLRGLMEGATRGPWKTSSHLFGSIVVNGTCDTIDCLVQSTIVTVEETTQEDGDGRVWTALGGSKKGNRKLIVAAVNLLPALAAVVEAATKARDILVENDLKAERRAIEALNKALSALDEAVRMEVGNG